MNLKITFLLYLFIVTVGYSQGVVSENGRLRVDGNQIKNQNNDPFSVSGNSFFWSGFQFDGGFYYETEVVNQLVSDWNSQLVRAAMAVEEADAGRGYISDPGGEVEKIRTVVDAAIANDIYVIIDFHSHQAQDFRDEAITFFTQMVNEYGDNDHIIYEIFNEPIGEFAADRQRDLWENVIKPYSNAVIEAIRDEEARLGYSNKLIIVGTPFFSSGIDIASESPIANSTSNNLAYTLHFYAGAHEQSFRDNIQTALDNGISVFVTEWGTVNPDGDGPVDVEETNIWMRFLKENNISNANWSVSNKDEGASIIRAGQRVNGQPAAELISGNLTPSGDFVRCIVSKWNEEETYSDCTSTAETDDTPPPPTGEGDCEGVEAPNTPAVEGIKVQIETTVGTVDAGSNANSDFRTAELTRSSRTLDCEAILEGFMPGQAAAFRIETNEEATYTFLVELSSTASNYTLELQRDSGQETLASQIIPNTGGLENYRVLTIEGVQLPGGNPDIAISIGGAGSGVVNIESFTYLIESATLSSSDFSIENAVTVYPNPVKETLNFVGLENVANTMYAIYSITGAEVVPATRLTSEKIEVGDLTRGVYFIKIEQDKNISTLKIIKE